MRILVFFLLINLSTLVVFGQDDELSNIQQYTPSKLLEKGKYDIKWFNNLYTQTTAADKDGEIMDVDRSNFFNTSVEAFTGISDNKVFNLGLIIEFRSNTIGGQDITSVFSFANTPNEARAGIGHIAPSLKIAPFKKISNLSLQTTFYIPLFDEETKDGVFLSQNSYIWQNRFFYDHTFSSGNWQLFSEIGTRLFLGEKEEGFANNSLEVAPSVFLSYFPTDKFTILAFGQHFQLLDLGNDFTQNFTAFGLGAKYQLTPVLNIEFLTSDFVRGNSSGTGGTINLGLRAIF